MSDCLKTIVLPLNKVVNCTQLLAFCLATEKTQMMVQLTAAREFRDNLSVPISSNSPPAVLLRFKFHESCGNNAHTWSGRTGTRRVFLTARSTHRTGERGCGANR